MKREDVVDTKPGYVYASGSQNPGTKQWGLLPRSGKAEVFQYPSCGEGRVVADVVRLDKGHTEGLEPLVTEELVKMLVTARGGRIRGAAPAGAFPSYLRAHSWNVSHATFNQSHACPLCRLSTRGNVIGGVDAVPRPRPPRLEQPEAVIVDGRLGSSRRSRPRIPFESGDVEGRSGSRRNYELRRATAGSMRIARRPSGRTPRARRTSARPTPRST